MSDQKTSIEGVVFMTTTILTAATKMIFIVSELIKNSNLDEADKETLIKRIREAQESVPEWK